MGNTGGIAQRDRISATAPVRVRGVAILPPGVAGPITQIELFQKEFEAVFAMLAERLPRLAGEVSAMSQAVRALRDDVGQESLAGALNATVEAATELQAQLRQVVALNQTVVDAASPLVTAVTEMSSTLDGIIRLSRNLALTGLNASVAAAHTGQEGVAFATLTTALRSLADDSDRQAKKVRDVSHEIRDRAHVLLQVQRELETDFLQATERGSAAVRSAVDELQEALTDVVRMAESVAARADGARAAIGTAMSALQRQDILRQGMDHVVLVLGELPAEYSRLASLTRSEDDDACARSGSQFVLFQSRAAKLAGELIADIDRDLAALVADVSAPVAELRSASQELTVVHRARTSEVRARLLTPSAAVQTTLAGLPRLSDIVQRYDGITLSLSQLVASLPSHLADFVDIERRLRVVAVLVKIEVARCDSLANAGTIAAELGASADSLKAFLKATHVTIGSFLQQIGRLKRASSSVSQHQGPLALARERLASASQSVQTAGERYVGGLDQASQAGTRLANDVSIFEARLAKFVASMKTHEAIREGCAAVAASAEQARAALIDAGAARPTDELSSGKMQELIDRFTFVAHKELARSMADVSVESGDAGGELTLF